MDCFRNAGDLGGVVNDGKMWVGKHHQFLFVSHLTIMECPHHYGMVAAAPSTVCEPHYTQTGSSID